MKLLFLRWTMGVWLVLVGTVGLGERLPAQAAPPLALSFDLPESTLAKAEPEPPPAPVTEVDPNLPKPLPIPPQATRPPMRHHSQLPSGVLTKRGELAALEQGHSPAALLPPAPPWVAPLPEIVVAEAVPEPSTEPEPIRDIALAFDLEATTIEAPAIAQTTAPSPADLPPLPADWLPWLFEGESQSLVARAVGMAEGTRTVDGGITSAYHGHTDPGNRAWNLGTFSYQHGASSVEEADRKQIQRLQQQTDVLRRRALRHGLTLTLEETLNGIDLANQSPLAAIGPVGYIERLAEVKHHWGLSGTEAIVVARTRSYINPRTGRWNAPGLGNTEASITRDQRRRADAVARALAAYPKPWPHLQATTPIVGAPPPVAPAAPEPEPLPPIAVAFWPSETAKPDPDPPDPGLAEDGAIATTAPSHAAESPTPMAPSATPVATSQNSGPTESTTTPPAVADAADNQPAPIPSIAEEEPAAPSTPTAPDRDWANPSVNSAPAPLVMVGVSETAEPLAAPESPAPAEPELAESGAIESPSTEPGLAHAEATDLGLAEPEAVEPELDESESVQPEIGETAIVATVRPTRPAPVERIFSGQAAVDDLELVPGATPDVQVYFPWTRDRPSPKPILDKASPASSVERAAPPALNANPTAQADDSQ